MARRKSRKGRKTGQRSKFAAVAKVCLRKTEPFTKAYGRCFKTEYKKRSR